ncbi:MAG TPA: general secretion pathway protein GspB [Candidatus Nitrosopolaris sp.]|nr:general secretion pathway protein GspB [Candidatus Nitrosopolaris sp.]
MQLSFLIYSRTPERRSVVLSVDGGSLVTLREGETAAGLTVARILPDCVHLRMGSQVFAIQPRD